MSNSNGCITQHTVLIHDRGGNRRIDQVNQVSSVEWNRNLSTRSAAQVTLNAAACSAQAELLSKIEPRRHEVVIFRGNDRVWEGPIVDAAFRRGGLTLTAKDVTEYVAHTPLTKDWIANPAGTDLVTDRLMQILAYELTTPYSVNVSQTATPQLQSFPRWETINPAANVLPFLEARVGSTRTNAQVLAFQMAVMDHIQDFATLNQVLYTVVGRKILLWDPDTSIGRLKTLTAADFTGDIDVYADGTELDVIGHISGARTAGSSMSGVGSAGAPDPFYGVWTRIDSSTSETNPTAASLNGQAANSIAGRAPVPLDIRVPDGSGLRLGRDLTVNQLVPGVLAPIRATLNYKEVSQVQRLSKVTVKEDAGKENVQVTFVRSAA
jgi:hypothetical protein